MAASGDFLMAADTASRVWGSEARVTATLAAITTGATIGAATAVATVATVLTADCTKPTGLMSMQMPQQ
jgi:hypothetical protein